eukprot:353944-Chlamydomonas_euryale.AAC.1
MDGWMDGWMDGCMVGCMDGCIDKMGHGDHQSRKQHGVEPARTLPVPPPISLVFSMESLVGTSGGWRGVGEGEVWKGIMHALAAPPHPPQERGIILPARCHKIGVSWAPCHRKHRICASREGRRGRREGRGGGEGRGGEVRMMARVRVRVYEHMRGGTSGEPRQSVPNASAGEHVRVYTAALLESPLVSHRVVTLPMADLGHPLDVN